MCFDINLWLFPLGMVLGIAAYELGGMIGRAAARRQKKA